MELTLKLEKKGRHEIYLELTGLSKPITRVVQPSQPDIHMQGGDGNLNQIMTFDLRRMVNEMFFEALPLMKAEHSAEYGELVL